MPLMKGKLFKSLGSKPNPTRKNETLYPSMCPSNAPTLLSFLFYSPDQMSGGSGGGSAGRGRGAIHKRLVSFLEGVQRLMFAS